ncbi:MAG: nitrophenyl compound nitroreductase subunit ArsF family protein [Parcubacteria group bacterium]
MQKINSYLFYSGLIFIIAATFLWINYDANRKNVPSVSAKKAAIGIAKTEESKPAEKIQVFLFHATQRCSSCIAIGKYAQETVEQKFPDELKSGRIEFKEINIDLPENKELAIKFKATGSALFINPIFDGQDHIKDDTRVWQLVSNEQGFISYLSDKLHGMLGSEASAQEK